MSKALQNLKSQSQKSQYTNQSSAGKAGKNSSKDEPKAQKKTSAMKSDARLTSGKKSSFANKLSQTS
jgi:hypothetical protein